MKHVFLIISLLFIMSCQKKSDDSISISQLTRPYQDIYKEAIIDGNIQAYYQLSNYYMDSPYPGFLHTALMMANKHKNKAACMDVFDCLWRFGGNTKERNYDYENKLDDLDSVTKSMALKYLKLASDDGSIEAKELLSKYYIEGRYLKKNEELGKTLLKEVDSLQNLP